MYFLWCEILFACSFFISTWLFDSKPSVIIQLQTSTCKFEFEFGLISNMAARLSSCISWDDLFDTLYLYCLETYRHLSLFIYIHGTPGFIFKSNKNSKIATRWLFAHLCEIMFVCSISISIYLFDLKPSGKTRF